jgi:hypothetical protein
MASLVLTATTANAQTEIPLTVDEANTTQVWLGSKAGLVNDPFANQATNTEQEGESR